MKIFAYIKYSLLFFAKHSGLYILMILQLAFLLLAENILIANLNSRDVLYAPYENIISHDGYYFMQPYASDGIRDENGDMIKTNDEILQETLAKLKGSYKLYCFYHGTLEDEGINIRVIDDTVFAALSLPLEDGVHSKNACLVTKNNIGLKAGDEADIDGVKIKISGVLSDKTYLPDYSLIDAEMSVEQLYQAYSFSKDFESDESQYMEYTEIIAPYSLLKESIENGVLYRSGKMLIAFDKPLSQSDKAYNEQVLTAADCDEPGWLISFEQIRRKGENYRSEDFYKMLPIVACILVVIIVGVVCSSAMISARQMKKFRVLYINGATSADCLMISCLTALVSSIIALALAAAVLKLGIANSFANELGFVIGVNNVFATAAVIVFAVAAFGVVPSVILRKKRLAVNSIE